MLVSLALPAPLRFLHPGAETDRQRRVLTIHVPIGVEALRGSKVVPRSRRYPPLHYLAPILGPDGGPVVQGRSREPRCDARNGARAG